MTRLEETEKNFVEFLRSIWEEGDTEEVKEDDCVTISVGMYPEQSDNLKLILLLEIAKSLAVIADHFTAEDEYMKKNAIEAFSDMLFQTNKTPEEAKND